MIMATLIAVVTLAARPIPSAVVTATVSKSKDERGSIARGVDVPEGAHIFNDREEVLTAISTTNYMTIICEINMVGLTK
jgi:hypothetical protein